MAAGFQDESRYRVGGLDVRSRFAIRGLHQSGPGADGACEIAVSLDGGRGPVPEKRLFQWPGRYGLCLWRTSAAWQFTSARDGSFLVSNDGSSIRCFTADDGSRRLEATAGLQHMLARRVLPRVGVLHGRVGLHAASVGDGRAAMVLVGTTRAGKSTLSAALNQRLGWQVLADDISLIEARDRPARCFRVGTGACLRYDALLALQIPRTVLRRIPRQDEKRWCAADADGGAGAAPVRAIVFLEKEVRGSPEGIRLSRISPSRAVIKAMASKVLFNPTDVSAVGAVMNSLARVMEDVPAYDLSYPRSFDLLPAVADRIRGCLEGSAP